MSNSSPRICSHPRIRLITRGDDAVFPGAPAAFLHECEEQGIDEDDARVILWDTPLRFYGLGGRFK